MCRACCLATRAGRCARRRGGGEDGGLSDGEQRAEHWQHRPAVFRHQPASVVQCMIAPVRFGSCIPLASGHRLQLRPGHNFELQPHRRLLSTSQLSTNRLLTLQLQIVLRLAGSLSLAGHRLSRRHPHVHLCRLWSGTVSCPRPMADCHRQDAIVQERSTTSPAR